MTTLQPALTYGKFSVLGAGLLVTLTSCPPNPGPPVPTTCTLSAQEWAAIEAPGHSQARVWNELTLHAIRSVLPQPTAHARNLFHVSAAMYDVWASYSPTAQGVFTSEKHSGPQADVATALNYAAHRVLAARFGQTVPALRDCFDQRLRHVALNPDDQGTTGDTPAATGNRIGQAVLDAGQNDGSNEANSYADTSAYAYLNPSLQPQFPGTLTVQPDHWQRLLLEQPFTQNGIPQSGPQPFMGAHWGSVKPFAMTRAGNFYHDPGPAPSISNPLMRSRWIPDVLRKEAWLDVNDPATIDISPGAMGNNPLGTNDGTGHPLNPATGQPYPPNVVKRADYGRVIAEFWADGPRSETPPGHWNVLANEVTDSPGFQRRIGGTGPVLSPLEWDVKLYLALNGALHDAAISAWEIKRQTDTARPISLIRYLAQQNADGLQLEPGVTEVQGGQLLVKRWNRGAGVRWEDPLMWVPYQDSTFVTPAFPGFISGHSTFSRAAAEVLTDLTGSAFFPGGLHEQTFSTAFIRIDAAPLSAPLKLGWATYYDAADQSGQSRIWGGIHIEPDDLVGRHIGHAVGLDAVALARKYFAGTAR